MRDCGLRRRVFVQDLRGDVRAGGKAVSQVVLHRHEIRRQGQPQFAVNIEKARRELGIYSGRLHEEAGQQRNGSSREAKISE